MTLESFPPRLGAFGQPLETKRSESSARITQSHCSLRFSTSDVERPGISERGGVCSLLLFGCFVNAGQDYFILPAPLTGCISIPILRQCRWPLAQAYISLPSVQVIPASPTCCVRCNDLRRTAVGLNPRDRQACRAQYMGAYQLRF